MALPFLIPLILGAMATAAGTATQMRGARKSQQEMEKKAQQEMERQWNVYRKKSQEALTQNIRQASPEQSAQSLKASADQALADYNRAMVDTESAVPALTPGQSSYTVPSSQQNEANQEFFRRAANLAGVRGLSRDWGLGNAYYGDLLNQYANFAQGSARVLPWELERASHAGDALIGAGGILKPIGAGLMGLGGLMAAIPATTASTAATTGGALTAGSPEGFAALDAALTPSYMAPASSYSFTIPSTATNSMLALPATAPTFASSQMWPMLGAYSPSLLGSADQYLQPRRRNVPTWFGQ